MSASLDCDVTSASFLCESRPFMQSTLDFIGDQHIIIVFYTFANVVPTIHFCWAVAACSASEQFFNWQGLCSILTSSDILDAVIHPALVSDIHHKGYRSGSKAFTVGGLPTTFFIATCLAVWYTSKQYAGKIHPPTLEMTYTMGHAYMVHSLEHAWILKWDSIPIGVEFSSYH